MTAAPEFVLKEASIICPDCDYPFATLDLVSMPNLVAESAVEADLHRILDDPAIRGALIAVCPACTYSWWISAFRSHHFVPELLVPAPPIEYSKKSGNPAEIGRWLKLAVNELKTAMEHETWQGNTSRYSYILGELLRLMGDFHSAVSYFQKVDRRSLLPKELVEHQIAEAKAGNSQPVLLPPRMVEEIFRLKPPVIELPEPTPMLAEA